MLCVLFQYEQARKLAVIVIFCITFITVRVLYYVRTLTIRYIAVGCSDPRSCSTYPVNDFQISSENVFKQPSYGLCIYY